MKEIQKHFHERAFATFSDSSQFCGLWALLNSMFVYHGAMVPAYVLNCGLNEGQIDRLRRHPLAPVILFDDEARTFFMDCAWQRQRMLLLLLAKARYVYFIETGSILASSMEDVFGMAEQGFIVALDQAQSLPSEQLVGDTALSEALKACRNSPFVCFDIYRHVSFEMHDIYWSSRRTESKLSSSDNAVAGSFLKRENFVFLSREDQSESLDDHSVTILGKCADGTVDVVNKSTGRRQRLIFSKSKWWKRENQDIFGDKLKIFRHFYELHSPLSASDESKNQIQSEPNKTRPRKLILKNFLSPGDLVMLTAAVRDLHKSHPGRFVTDVRTPCPDLWTNNPHIVSLDDSDSEAESISCQYPLIHSSNNGPWHFIHGFMQFLSHRLGVKITPTEFKGDIHLSALERENISQVEEMTGMPVPFWVVTAGGKRDYTIKWWARERYQAVVDHFREKILFVQVGEAGHEHQPLEGVLDLRGKTSLRQLVRLVYHAQGVLCPVTLLMHLAAAVPVRVGMPQGRPCVVVAGGREPSQWEAYPHHQFIHTQGALSCCSNGGCWKSRTHPLGDGDAKDKPRDLCLDVVFKNSVEGSENVSPLPGKRKNALAYPPISWPQLLPRCMDLITTEEVIRRIELYFKGGMARYLTVEERNACAHSAPGWRRVSSASNRVPCPSC